MLHRFKIKGLALAVVVGLVAAGPAQAAELHATTPEKTVITGKNQLQTIFSTTGGLEVGYALQCTQSAYEGTVVSQPQGLQQTTAKVATLTPTFSNCHNIFTPFTARMNGCKFRLNGEGQPPLTALVDIVGCTAGKKIEFQSVPCQITIGEQSGLSHVTFTNNAGPPHSVTVDFTIKGLAYELHGLSCGHGTTALTQDGIFLSAAELQAYKDLGSHLATEHGHQFSKNTHDNVAVGLTAT